MAHSSFCSASTLPTSRMTARSFGKCRSRRYAAVTQALRRARLVIRSLPKICARCELIVLSANPRCSAISLFFSPCATRRATSHSENSFQCNNSHVYYPRWRGRLNTPPLATCCGGSPPGCAPPLRSPWPRSGRRTRSIRRPHPAYSRSMQLRLTKRGSHVAERTIAIVHALQDEFTAPIGGTQSQRTCELVRTLETLLFKEQRNESMSSAAATLTGQDVGEAEGALTGLLERLLDGTNTGLSRTEYITLRLVAARGAAHPPAALHDFLADQPQLGLDRSQVAELLRGLEVRGLIANSDPAGPGPIELTAAGAARHASVAESVTAVTRRLYADLNPDDLAIAHNVLAEVTQRANRLRHEL